MRDVLCILPCAFNILEQENHLLISELVPRLVAGVLDRVDSKLNGVEENIARLEVGVDGPGTKELSNTI
jgi:hypothetical protein